MKRILLLFSSIVLINAVLFSQDIESQKTEIRQKTAEMIAHYQNGNLKNAQKSAEAALKLALANLGENHQDTGIAFKNLGEIFRAREKFDEASENLSKALKIFQNEPKYNLDRIVQTLENLGVCLTLAGKPGHAEIVFSGAVEFIGDEFGDNSPELMRLLRLQTNFYVRIGNFRLADDLYIKRYLNALDTNGEAGFSTGDIAWEHYCYCIRNFDVELSKTKRKGFREIIKTLRPESEEPKQQPTNEIVNGKAISLPRPEYPPMAKYFQRDVAVAVTVIIGTDGRVKSANATCGNGYLEEISEEAAMKARFKPTLSSGIAVEVTGIIIYNFLTGRGTK